MDNTLIINGNEYKMEKVWRDSKYDKNRDSKGKLFPFPIPGNYTYDINTFIKKLKAINDYLDSRKKYKDYNKNKHCLICKKKNITKKQYIYGRVIWEDGLIHYIHKHKIEPSLYFRKFIYNNRIFRNSNNLNRNNILSDNTDIKKKAVNMILEKISKNNNMYVIIERNQLLILDALMIHGGYQKKYIDNNRKQSRYSEHAGLLDFENRKLTKIVVSGLTNRVDDGDDEIYLPANMQEMFDYEYIFHTHPPTPKPGGRAEYGILYEFPSIGDIYHFIDHHNEGNVIGSLVVTAEGLYNIRKFNNDNKNINIDEDSLFHDYQKTFDRIQLNSIKKYGDDFTDNEFYSLIAQDTRYIKKLNDTLESYDLYIDYYPRKKGSNNKWYIDTLFLVFRENKVKN